MSTQGTNLTAADGYGPPLPPIEPFSPEPISTPFDAICSCEDCKSWAEKTDPVVRRRLTLLGLLQCPVDVSCERDIQDALFRPGKIRLPEVPRGSCTHICTELIAAYRHELVHALQHCLLTRGGFVPGSEGGFPSPVVPDGQDYDGRMGLPPWVDPRNLRGWSPRPRSATAEGQCSTCLCLEIQAHYNDGKSAVQICGDMYTMGGAVRSCPTFCEGFDLLELKAKCYGLLRQCAKTLPY